MVSLSRHKNTAIKNSELRPVNLRTDLAPLADLIELVFSDSMDSNGRAALREMRYLSKMGPGLPLISRMNEMAMGINLGYVWIANNNLVGNVSVYPTHMPRDMGEIWIIANVGVHPDYQRRGIARKLMVASMDMIRSRNAKSVILQVDVDNHSARNLYHSLGFIDERIWTVWQRTGSNMPPPLLEHDVYVRRRRRSEWRDELALAHHIRPQQQGGIGWLRPTHVSQFQRSFFKQLSDWMNLRNTERLVIRPQQDDTLAASLWVDNAVGGRTKLTLLVDPRFRGYYDRVLLNTIVRRLGRSNLSIEHPDDDVITSQVLQDYQFKRQRTVVHMRWDVK